MFRIYCIYVHFETQRATSFTPPNVISVTAVTHGRSGVHYGK